MRAKSRSSLIESRRASSTSTAAPGPPPAPGRASIPSAAGRGAARPASRRAGLTTSRSSCVNRPAGSSATSRPLGAGSPAMLQRTVGKARLVLVQGDITRQDTDAIVNAANPGLMGGGGVDGAIHRAGGPQILEECKVIVARQGRCPAGGAVVTGGGRLKASHVIHAVGPIWRGGGQGAGEVLRRAYGQRPPPADRSLTSAIPTS